MSDCIPPAQPVRVRSTCDVCLDAKVRCSRDRPACRRCQHHGRDCVYSNKRRLGRPRGTTSKSRAAPSTEPAGIHIEHSMNDGEMLATAVHANATLPASSHGLPLESMLSLNDRQHIAFRNGSQDDPSYFSSWPSSGDQRGRDASSYDSSRLVDSRIDHNQHAIFNRSYPDIDNGPLGVESNYSLSLVDSASTAGLASHTGSPLNYVEAAGHATPSSYLNPVDHRTYDVGGLSPSEVSVDYNFADNPVLATNTNLSPRCLCYCNILQRLSELKDNKSGDPFPRVEYVMKLEMDIRAQIMAVMRCDLCLFQRARTLLLVGVVLESVVDLLEGIVVADSLMGVGERYARQTLDDRSRGSSSSGSGTLYSTSLPNPFFSNGINEVYNEEWRALHHPLLRARLQEVFGLARQLHEHAQNFRAPTTHFGAADTAMAELSLRVCALMGRMEGR